MRFIILLCSFFIFNHVSSIPPSVKMVDYIGMSVYQPPFNEVYAEMSGLKNKPLSEIQLKENEIYYDGAVFEFDNYQRLVEIKFSNQMPYGLRSGMGSFWANFKLRLKGIKKKDGRSKDGYIVLLNHLEGQVESMKVTIQKELREKRKNVPYQINGHRFEKPDEFERYYDNPNRNSELFIMMRPEDGTCISGDCSTGTGKMRWENIDFLRSIQFEGRFIEGKPINGEVVFESGVWGTGHNSYIFVTDFHSLRGDVELTQKNGNQAKLYFLNDRVYSVENLDLGKYLFTGLLTEWLTPKLHESTPSKYIHKDKRVEMVLNPKSGWGTGWIWYNSGLRYRGDISMGLNEIGYGKWTDTTYGGTLETFFDSGVPQRNVWKYENGLTREGKFDPINGFDDMVVTNLETYQSHYKATGLFNDHKPHGIHTLIDKSSGKTIATSRYDNGRLMTGRGFYSKGNNVFTEYIHQDQRLELDFQKMANHIRKELGTSIRVDHINYKFTSSQSRLNKKVDVNSDDKIRFIVFDPFSKADQYLLNITSPAGNLGIPEMVLKPDPSDPRYYIGGSVLTRIYDEFLLELYTDGAKKDKYMAELFLIYD